ncbi:MAG: MFS transporter [Armatimonadetes bacterium]|nr:MFS transporter [Armatimonadota bacterium]
MNPPTSEPDPLPPDPSREAYVRRHLRFNLAAFFIDAMGWWLGMSFFSAQTLLPYFVKAFGGGDILVGLIPAVFSLGYLFPQLFVAPLTERRQIQRRVVLRIAWFERIAMGLLAPLTFFLAGTAPGLLLAGFFLCIGANAVAMGTNMPGYSTLLTKTIPVDVRGRYWGISGAVAALIAMGGAELAAWLLKGYGTRVGFTLCFLIGFVVLAVTVVPLGWIREPKALDSPHHPNFRAYLSETKGILRRHPGYLRLIVADWLFAFAGTAAAFYTVYAMSRFGAGPLAVGRFTMTLLAAGVIGGFVWGAVSDRFGNRRTLQFSAAFMLAAPLLALFAPSLLLFYAVFFLSGIAFSAFELGMFNITLEFAGETKVATFQGVRALAVAPARGLFPLLGGMLAKSVGYGWVFALSAAAAVAAILMLLAVPDPRHHPVGFRPDPTDRAPDAATDASENDATDEAEEDRKESGRVRIER